MAAPCIEHLFLTGEKGVGKSTLVWYLLQGHSPCGFRTLRVEGVLERPSVHLLPAVGGTPSAENLLFCCGGGADPRRFDQLGCQALAAAAGCELLVMDELGPHEAEAEAFRQAVLAALDGPAPICGVLQQADSAFLDAVAAHPRVRVVTVTEENRDGLRLWLKQQKK